MTILEREYILAELVKAIHEKADRRASRRATSADEHREMYETEVRLLMFEIVEEN